MSIDSDHLHRAAPVETPFLGTLDQAHGTATAVVDTTVYTRFEDAEAVWRSLEAGAWMSPYQSFDFLAQWQATIGTADGVQPRLVVLRDARGAAALWPLGVSRMGPARVARFLGGKHANYNMPVLRADIAADGGIIAALLDTLELKALADVLVLHNQPERWAERDHPLRAWPHQPSASFAYSAPLLADADASVRALRSGSSLRKLGRIERRLAETHGAVSLERVQPGDDPEPFVTLFQEQKALRMAELGLANVFAEPNTKRFLSNLAGLSAKGTTVDIYWLKVGDAVAGTWWGIVQGNRFSGMVNSHDMERFGKYPIGDIMLRRMIEDVSRRGVTCFDLGVGESDYKNHWCPDTDRLFETILPLTALGYPISLSLRGFHATKRRIKHDETLMGLVKKLRTPGK